MSGFDAIYVSIGNSDDKLTQVEWSEYVSEIFEAVRDQAKQIFGEWHSHSASEFQNACIAAAIRGPEAVDDLRRALTTLRTVYRQDSVAWAVVPRTEFI